MSRFGSIVTKFRMSAIGPLIIDSRLHGACCERSKRATTGPEQPQQYGCSPGAYYGTIFGTTLSPHMANLGQQQLATLDLCPHSALGLV